MDVAPRSVLMCGVKVSAHAGCPISDAASPRQMWEPMNPNRPGAPPSAYFAARVGHRRTYRPAPLLLNSFSGLLFPVRPAQGDDLQPHRGKPGLGHGQLLGCAIGEVDDAPLVPQVAAIRDAHHDRPFVLELTTRTIEPKGSVGWQAVIAYMSNRSPLAVRRPLKTPPYQEAMPVKHFSRIGSCGFLRRKQSRRRACYGNRRGRGCR